MLDKNLNDSFRISALLLKKLNDSLTTSEASELDEWTSHYAKIGIAATILNAFGNHFLSLT